MKSAFYLGFVILALGVAALWCRRMILVEAEPPPRIVRDMTCRPETPPRPIPPGAIPFEEADRHPAAASPDGEELFLLHCAACHGADGTGQSYVARQSGMPDVSDLTATDSSPEELSRTLDEGRGAMPAFGARLGEEKRRALIRYITTLHRP